MSVTIAHYTTTKSESDLEAEICSYLRNAGRQVERQVRCATGTADIVTDAGVLEVKRVLTRDSLIRGIGQVLLYRAAINPDIGAVVIGKLPREGLDMNIVRYARSLGVLVWGWRNGAAIHFQTYMNVSP